MRPYYVILWLSRLLRNLIRSLYTKNTWTRVETVGTYGLTSTIEHVVIGRLCWIVLDRSTVCERFCECTWWGLFESVLRGQQSLLLPWRGEIVPRCPGVRAEESFLFLSIEGRRCLRANAHFTLETICIVTHSPWLKSSEWVIIVAHSQIAFVKTSLLSRSPKQIRARLSMSTLT